MNICAFNKSPFGPNAGSSTVVVSPGVTGGVTHGVTHGVTGGVAHGVAHGVVPGATGAVVVAALCALPNIWSHPSITWFFIRHKAYAEPR